MNSFFLLPQQQQQRKMMIGETHRSYPTVEVPPWDYYSDDPTANSHSPFALDKCAFTALQSYLPSNDKNGVVSSSEWEDFDVNVDAFASDYFRIYEFKVRRCARARSHDWTECPFAHPGEKARRRDPRKFHYSGASCPDFRKGQCVRGDACEYAHGVFECWLHPARYRTQPCKDGTHCQRKICFFAHTADQLRLLPPSTPGIADGFVNESLGRLGGYSFDGSLSRLDGDSFGGKLSPTSTLYSPPWSPPMSPCESVGFNSVSELVGSMRSMKIGNVNGGMSMSPPAWGGGQMGSGFGSFRLGARVRPGFASLPGTPTRSSTRSGLGVFDLWDQSSEEEPVMERVESGRELRAKIYAKLSRENSLARVDSVGSGLDVGWVSELVK